MCVGVCGKVDIELQDTLYHTSNILWVAVKEHKLSFPNSGTFLSGVCPYDGNLNYPPEQQPSNSNHLCRESVRGAGSRFR